MTKKLWIDPYFGASGDMLLGVMVSLGANFETIESALRKLDIPGWGITQESVQRAGLNATKVTVSCEDDQHHRHWSFIDDLLERSDLPSKVEQGARATFLALATAEAQIHSTSIDQVHFHEVGAVDAIVDIVGSWIGLDLLKVDEVICSSIGLGQGKVEAAHGTLATPAPATLRLLEGAPVHGIDFPGESVTPTGAALLATMNTSWGRFPDGKLITSGRGAGTRSPDTHANVVTGSIIESPSGQENHSPENLIIVSTNLDDVTPEVLGHTLSTLLAAGALDAWILPVQMKKSRPGHCLQALCEQPLVSKIQEIIFQETATLGIRTQKCERTSLPRQSHTVTIEGQSISIKSSDYGTKPEYDDLVKASKNLRLPLKEITQKVQDTLRES